MRKTASALAALVSAILATSISTSCAQEKPGYKDTAILPDQKWHVHDPDRPVPPLVTPGETFSHNAPPPSDAIVLFDGKDISKWRSDSGPAGWKVENGYMEVVKDSGSIRTRDEFSDFQLHLEFATPAKVEGSSQGRGNSGIYLCGRYEVQILDSYNNPTYPDGQLGAMYGQFPPLATAPKKPGEWQTYDIIFEVARWDENRKLIKPASVTVILNGIVLHNKKEFIGGSTHRELPVYRPHAPRGPISLQDHGNPTRFRNIWLRPLGEYDKP